MPFAFHRSLHAFTSTVPNTTGGSLDHPYVARVELTHGTPLPVREHWKEVVQEPAVVRSVSPGPECEEANTSLFPTTRFLCHLKKDLFPIHFDFTVDSDGDYLHLHSPFQTIAHTLWLGNLQPSFTPITQVSALLEERPQGQHPHTWPTSTRLITRPVTPPGSRPTKMVESGLHLDPVVLRLFDGMACILERFKRQGEEPEQEEAPRKKRTHKRYKCEICRQEDDM